MAVAVFTLEKIMMNYLAFRLALNVGGNAGNEILNWPANTFAISTHNNNTTGLIAFSINRGTGNIGIGTGIATTKLHIAGTGSGVRVELATGGSVDYHTCCQYRQAIIRRCQWRYTCHSQRQQRPGTYHNRWYGWGAAGTSGWELTGNSGTTAGTNFLGTADAVDMEEKQTTPSE